MALVTAKSHGIQALNTDLGKANSPPPLQIKALNLQKEQEE